MAITFSMFLNLFMILFLLSPTYAVRQDCCKDKGVPEKCYKYICDPTGPLKTIWRYKVWDPEWSCQNYLPAVSQCLSDGRDVSNCAYKESDIEFDICLSLSNGTMVYDIKKKNPFLSCFVLNSPVLFKCFMSSYTNAPTQPRDLELSSKTEDTAVLKWKEPAQLADKVRIYKVYLIERNNMEEFKTVKETTDLEYTFEELSTDSSYSVYVVAHGEVYKNDDEWHRSQFSNTVSFITGEEIQVSREEVKTPAAVKYIDIPCLLKSITNTEGVIEWVKMTDGIGNLLENGTKYSIVSYASLQDPKTLVSAMRIMDFEVDDFATYRCYVKDTRLEYAEVAVISHSYSEEAPNDNPPETLLECCSKGVHSPECESVCNGQEITSKEVRPGAYLATGTGCKRETDILFKCSQKSADNAGCCIQKEVPFHCLGMCDSRFSMATFKMKTCQKFVKTIYNCQLELINLKPEAISFVKATHSYGYTYTFKWDKAIDAEVYNIYTRKNKGRWTARVTVDNAVDVTDVDEAVLFSANHYGISQQYRMAFDDDAWFTIDY